MRKTLLTLSLLLLSGFATLQDANASSGACSGHDGVNCLAGHDSDGSVICNDGWTDSSVQYVDIKDVCLENYLEPGPFYDVSQSNPNREAILYLFEEGIINGYPDKTFKPANEINRAELLKILVEGLGTTPDVATYNGCFNDVKTDWYAPYVCYAKEQKWVEGYTDGNFRPSQTVNKVEAIKMLLNSQKITIPESISEAPFTDVTVDQWFAPYIKVAKDLQILEETGSYLQPAQNMTRGSVSENLYRLLTNTSSDQPTTTESSDNKTVATATIKAHCEDSWPDDTDMQKFCSDNQYDSWENLFNDKPSYVTDSQYSVIIAECKDQWSTDYSMQEFCREDEYNGIETINLPKPSYVTDSQYTIVKNHCSESWEKDYSMQAFCYEQQFDGIEEVNMSTATTSQKSECSETWPEDFSMQAYCLEQ